MSRRLRVLMVCPQFRPLIGGYERAAERLSSALAERGHEVTVVTERRNAAWPPKEQDGGVLIRRLRVANRPGFHVITSVVALAAFLLVRGRSVDVFHVHQDGWAGAVAIAFGRLYRRPVVLKLTSTGEGSILVVLKRAGFGGLLAGLHRTVDACLASSNRVESEAHRFGIPKERIHRIPNGIDTDRLRPLENTDRKAVRARLGLAEEVTALFVGRLSGVKNPIGLLDAWTEMGPPAGAVLVFVGDGPDRTELEARGDRCGDSVKRIGFVSDPLPWFQAADLFVLPSIREGLSNSLLEALACGLPVVSTPVAGSEDIFAAADVGILVAGPDATSLARGLDALLSDPDRRARCGAEARRLAVERFSLDRVAGDVESLYWHLTRREPTVSARIHG